MTRTDITDLLKSYGLERFDKVPPGFPNGGCTRYKKLLPMREGVVTFLAAVVNTRGAWVLMDFTYGGNKHEELVHSLDEIEKFLRAHDDVGKQKSK